MENDTENGGEGLSIEQAVSAYAKSTANGTGNSQPVAEDEQGEQADDEVLESDEDDGAEDGNPDETGQSEDEDDEEQDSDQGRFVASNGKVRLPDGTVSTVADLIQGNLRERDYRQKTTALGEQRRSYEERSSALADVEASKQQVNEQREYMSRLLEAVTPQAPDPKMLETDPIGFMQAKHQHEQFSQHLQYLQHQMAEARKGNDEKAEQERSNHAKAELERLHEALPVLKDQEKGRAFLDGLGKAGATYGFTPQDLATGFREDHRYALVLRDAAKWQKLQANKANAVQQGQNRPPVQRGGKRLSTAETKMARANDALNRLKQSGSVEDAAAAYLARKG